MAQTDWEIGAIKDSGWCVLMGLWWGFLKSGQFSVWTPPIPANVCLGRMLELHCQTTVKRNFAMSFSFLPYL